MNYEFPSMRPYPKGQKASVSSPDAFISIRAHRRYDNQLPRNCVPVFFGNNNVFIDGIGAGYFRCHDDAQCSPSCCSRYHRMVPRTCSLINHMLWNIFIRTNITCCCQVPIAVRRTRLATLVFIVYWRCSTCSVVPGINSWAQARACL